MKYVLIAALFLTGCSDLNDYAAAQRGKVVGFSCSLKVKDDGYSKTSR